MVDRSPETGSPRDRYQAVTENPFAAIVEVDEQGLYRYVSPTFTELFGWTEAELLGRSFFDLVHPDDRAGVEARFVVDEIPLGQHGVEIRIRHANGTWRWIESGGRAFVDEDGRLALVGVLADVTARREVELALRDSESRFRALADSAPVMIWQSGADGLCTYVNREWLHFTGRKLEEELGQGWFSHVHSDDQKRHIHDLMRSFRKGEPIEIELRMLRHDGVWRRVLSRGQPRFGLSDVFLGYVGTNTDVTVLREADERLRRSERLSSLGTLAAGIAHEINNPLGGILISAEAAQLQLQRGDLAAARSTLDKVIHESQRAAGIVRNVLRFSRREESSRTQHDLKEVLETCAELVRTLGSGRGVAVETSLAHDLAQPAINRVEIEQVVVNLLSNAIQASPAGSSVWVRSQGLEGGVRLAVEDSGPGISEQDLPHLFDPFFTTRGTEGGTGLGLSVCHAIVLEHDGVIRALARPGGGTRFEVDLPC